MDRHVDDGATFEVERRQHRQKAMFAKHGWGASKVYADGRRVTRAQFIMEAHARRIEAIVARLAHAPALAMLSKRLG